MISHLDTKSQNITWSVPNMSTILETISCFHIVLERTLLNFWNKQPFSHFKPSFDTSPLSLLPKGEYILVLCPYKIYTNCIKSKVSDFLIENGEIILGKCDTLVMSHHNKININYFHNCQFYQNSQSHNIVACHSYCSFNN